MWDLRTLALEVNGASLELDTLVSHRQNPPVLFLHGFGSTKEDYADFAHIRDLAGIGFVTFDAPGFGRSTSTELSRVSIEFLADVADAVLKRLEIDEFHVVGHSMGGLTALLLAERIPDRVLSFVNIEGNLAQEDCFLSRQITDNPGDDPDVFLKELAARTHQVSESSSALYASNLQSKVRPAVVRAVFESLVDLSDHGDLLARFLGLPFPRLFMYGEQNAGLSYLPVLREHGVELAQIPFSGHWPMYSNPVAMWTEIAGFYDRHFDLGRRRVTGTSPTVVDSLGSTAGTSALRAALPTVSSFTGTLPGQSR
jgi:pimeloyl-ACP methyl ester carboxylesterase